MDLQTDEAVALKIFKKKDMNLFTLTAAHLEYSLSQHIDHENILRTKGYFEDTDYVIIVFELMSSDLRSLLIELDAPLTEQQIKEIFYQMVRSIEHCHSKNIVHRDVKLENFLVDTTPEGNILVKLSDFGLACKYEPERPPTIKCGSVLSVAPEMLVSESYGFEVDMWGLGVILHELLCTKLPFYNDDENLYKNNIVNMKLVLDEEQDEMWKEVSSEAKDLVKKLLDKKPKTRLNATDALRHRWFSDSIIDQKPGSGVVFTATTIDEEAEEGAEEDR